MARFREIQNFARKVQRNFPKIILKIVYISFCSEIKKKLYFTVDMIFLSKLRFVSIKRSKTLSSPGIIEHCNDFEHPSGGKHSIGRPIGNFNRNRLAWPKLYLPNRFRDEYTQLDRKAKMFRFLLNI